MSETWLDCSKNIHIKGFNIARKDRIDGYGGVLIACRQDITATRIDIVSNFECVSCSIQLQNKTISVGSLYLPPSNRLNTTDFKALVQQLPAPRFLLGDFNAHNHQWGSSFNDSRSQALLSIFDDLDMATLNTGAVTRIACPPHPGSSIDLSVCTANIALDCEWNVLDHTYGSDHLPILVSINIPSVRRSPRTINLCNKIDWPRYTDYVLTASADKIYNAQNTNQKYASLIEAITESARAAQPLPRGEAGARFCSARTPKFWWNDTLTTLHRNKKIAFQQFKRIGGQVEFLAYKKAQAAFKLEKNKAKAIKWKEYCSSINKDTNLSAMYRMARRYRGKQVRDQLTISSNDWMPDFANILAPPSAPVKPIYIEHELRDESFDAPFTLNELESALSKCKNSSPGLDNINFLLIKKLPIAVKKIFLEILNEIFNSYMLPNEWYSSKVVAILKPGKNPENATSYRPICLLSCPRKVFEKMLHARLDYWIESRGLSSKTQFGFKKGFGTQDAIATLSTNLAEVYAKKESCLAVFMDITSAYDDVQIDILCDIMRQLKMPSKAVFCIYALFSRRQLHFFIHNQWSETRTGYKGLAQGSTLSPLLFNVYTFYIESNVPTNLRILQYADDVVLYTSDNNVHLLQNRIQLGINAVHNEYLRLGLDISASKTEFVVFTKKYRLPNFNIRIDDVEIRQSFSFKYLGVIFDVKGTWRSQTDHIQKKCQKRVNFLRTIAGSSWGAHPDAMLLLYKTSVRSIMEYGSVAFRHMAATHLLKIKRIQWRALRTCMGLMTSTHTGSLEVILGVQPLEIRWKKLADKLLIKAFAGPSKILRNAIQSLTDYDPVHPVAADLPDCLQNIEYRPSFPCYSFPFKSIMYEPITNWKVKNEIKNFIDPSPAIISGIFAETVAELNPVKCIYTDGSKSTSGTGAAFFVDNLTNGMMRLAEPATVFDAELIGIVLAANYIKTQQYGRFIIASDSMSAVQALCNISVSTKDSMTLLRCRHALWALAEDRFEVILTWVPAHKGLRGNECADELAKLSTTAANIDPSHPPWANYAASLKSLYNRTWQYRWDDGDLGRFCYSIIPRVSMNPWYVKLDDHISRSELRTASRIIVNHYRLNHHLCRVNIVGSPLCEKCGAYESVDHVLFECPAPILLQHRPALVQRLRADGFQPPYISRDIMATTTSARTVRALHKFIVISDIKI